VPDAGSDARLAVTLDGAPDLDGPGGSDGVDRAPPPGLDEGVPCDGGSQCASNLCVDGVCCESSCTGQCQACAEPGSAGKCVTVSGQPRGTSRLACTGTGACGSRCDGTDPSRCRYPGNDVQCAGPSCVDGFSTAAAFCSGTGGCRVPGQIKCASNQCADATRCSSACGSAFPCGPGFYCDPVNSACRTLKATGTPCSSDTECASSACTDGVCCESRCGSQCQACAEPGMVGMCVTVSGEPRGTRAACAGAGACASSCGGSDPTQCSYFGSAVQCCSTSQPCPSTQYCDPATKACLDVKANGAPCAADYQCASSACVDGVCCDGRCAGQCEACAEPGSTGTCVPVTGVPRGGLRPACAGKRDACRGQCDGSSRAQCSYPGSSVQCTQASCSGGTLTTASVCNGGGDCTAQTTAMCHSTQCLNTTACLDACSATAPCAGSFYCDAGGVCRPQIVSGACQLDAQCSSGHCADGVCCNEACDDGCRRCNLAGSSGTCTTRFTEFSPAQGSAFESVPIVVGPDNNLWFLEEGTTNSFMGRITTAGAISEFPIIQLERGFMASGADGTIWFEDSTNDPTTLILRLTTSGAMAASFMAQPGDWGTGALLADPAAGGVWAMQVDESGDGQHQILLINGSRAVARRFNVPVVTAAMTRGPDGNLWFITAGKVWRLDTTLTGNAVSFPVTGANFGIAAGPDGNIWFSEPTTNKVGRMSTDGTLLDEFPLPTPASSPGAMIAGPGNLVWFAEFGPPRLARITTAGAVTECAVATKNTASAGEMVAGPDGNVWMTGMAPSGKTKIYRFLP